MFIYVSDQGQIQNLEDKNVRTTRFAIISSGTSGTVSLPLNSTVVLDDFGGTTDAVISQVSGGRPTYTSALDGSGNPVATSFDSSGNYVLTSSPSSYPIAIIYRVQQKLKNFDSTNTNIVGGPEIIGVNPGGTNQQLQYNNGGIFGGVNGSAYNGASLVLEDSIFYINFVSNNAFGRFDASLITPNATQTLYFPDESGPISIGGHGLVHPIDETNSFPYDQQPASIASGAVNDVGIGSDVLNSLTDATNMIGYGHSVFSKVSDAAHASSSVGIGINILYGSNSINRTTAVGQDIGQNVAALRANLYGNNIGPLMSGITDATIIATDFAPIYTGTISGGVFLGANQFNLTTTSIGPIVAIGGNICGGNDASVGTSVLIGQGIASGGSSPISIETSVVIGDLAAYTITSLSNSVLIGDDAGISAVILTRSIGIGTLALGSNISTPSSDIIGIGYGSGNGCSQNQNIVLLGSNSNPSAYNSTSEFCVGSEGNPITQWWLGAGGNPAFTAVNVNVSPTNVFGTNHAGATLAITGGAATGNANGGSILFKTSTVLGTGSTLQTQITAVGIDSKQRLQTYSGRIRSIRVVTAAGAVTVTTTDDVIIVNKGTGAATTVNLMASPASGTRLTIKDGKGDAATNNMTITPNAGNIDGAGTFVMNTNYQSNDFIYNGTQWNVV